MLISSQARTFNHLPHLGMTRPCHLSNGSQHHMPLLFSHRWLRPMSLSLRSLQHLRRRAKRHLRHRLSSHLPRLPHLATSGPSQPPHRDHRNLLPASRLRARPRLFNLLFPMALQLLTVPAVLNRAPLRNRGTPMDASRRSPPRTLNSRTHSNSLCSSCNIALKAPHRALSKTLVSSKVLVLVLLRVLKALSSLRASSKDSHSNKDLALRVLLKDRQNLSKASSRMVPHSLSPRLLNLKVRNQS